MFTLYILKHYKLCLFVNSICTLKVRQKIVFHAKLFYLYIIEDLPVSTISEGGVGIWLIVTLCCSAIVILIIGGIIIFIIIYKVRNSKINNNLSQETEQNSCLNPPETIDLLSNPVETVDHMPEGQETVVLISKPDATDSPTPGQQEAVVELSQQRNIEVFLPQNANPPHLQRTQSTPAPKSLRDPSLHQPFEFIRVVSSPPTVSSANLKSSEDGKYFKRTILKLNYNLFFNYILFQNFHCKNQNYYQNYLFVLKQKYL